MAILNRDQFFERINKILGASSDEDSIAFLEDMTDTFDDMERRANSPTDWEKKYNELDNAWREKYKKRFFSAPPRERESDADTEDETLAQEVKEESITLDELFDEKEEK